VRERSEGTRRLEIDGSLAATAGAAAACGGVQDSYGPDEVVDPTRATEPHSSAIFRDPRSAQSCSQPRNNYSASSTRPAASVHGAPYEMFCHFLVLKVPDGESQQANARDRNQA